MDFNGLWSLFLRISQGFPLPLGYLFHFLGNTVAGGSWQKGPRRFSLCGTCFQTLLIWVEQLGPLVPVEVQLAAPLSPGRQGEFSFSSFNFGIRWQSRSMPSGTSSPLPQCWVRSQPWKKGKARGTVLTYGTIGAFPLITLLSLFWYHTFWLIPT